MTDMIFFHRGNRPLALLLMCLLVGIGCAPTDVTYRLRFPSEEAFLMSSTARVEVYDGTGTGDQSPDAICRKLSVLQPAGVNTVAVSDVREVCEFLTGNVDLRTLEEGRLVFAASAVDANFTTILSGCAVVDVVPGVESVDIQLSTLPSYPDAPTPPHATLEEKCPGFVR